MSKADWSIVAVEDDGSEWVQYHEAESKLALAHNKPNLISKFTIVFFIVIRVFCGIIIDELEYSNRLRQLDSALFSRLKNGS